MLKHGLMLKYFESRSRIHVCLVPSVRSPVRQHKVNTTSAGVMGEKYDQRWHDIWDGGLQKGQKFDAARSSPALLNFLDTGKLDVADKRVVVPGCGRGYDLAAFVQHGAQQALGLELSPTAVQCANEWLDSAGLSPQQRQACQVQHGDFFESGAAQAYDVGYDYTFFCALHPSKRQEWAQTWHRRLAPSAKLVTLIFPIDSSINEGPPWPVTPELYEQTLNAAGFKKVLLESVPDALSHPGREGKEVLGVWERK